MAKEGLCPSVVPLCLLLPWASLQVCHSSKCSFRVVKDCRCLHCMHLQCLSLLDRHIRRESGHPQLSIEDLHTSSSRKAVAGPPLISVLVDYCDSHWAIIAVRSIGPPHPVHCYDYGYFVSWSALCRSFGCSVVLQNPESDRWFFAQGWPGHAIGFPAMLLLFLDYFPYSCTGRGVLV